MLFIIATVKTQIAKREEFIAAARICIDETRREAGCIAYDMHESVTEPGTFRFVERWENRTVIDTHLAAPHLKAFAALAAGYVSEPPQIELITPSGVELL